LSSPQDESRASDRAATRIRIVNIRELPKS
jgi:hypothetical protein